MRLCSQHKINSTLIEFGSQKEANFAETYFFEQTLSKASIFNDAFKEADLPTSLSADALTTPQTHVRWSTFGHGVAKFSDRKLLSIINRRQAALFFY